MTPKEKAIELVEDMHDAPETGYNEHAKVCALIAVDEVLSVIWVYLDDVDYWDEVKKEIEKL